MEAFREKWESFFWNFLLLTGIKIVTLFMIMIVIMLVHAVSLAEIMTLYEM